MRGGEGGLGKCGTWRDASGFLDVHGERGGYCHERDESRTGRRQKARPGEPSQRTWLHSQAAGGEDTCDQSGVAARLCVSPDDRIPLSTLLETAAQEGRLARGGKKEEIPSSKISDRL